MDAPGFGTCRFDDYTLDPRNGRLLRNGVEVPLRPKAFDVLCRLVEAAPDLLTKEQLIAAVWPKVVVSEDSLVQCVREIRVALHDDAQQIVRTVPRRGYAFSVPVCRGAPPAAARPEPSPRRWRSL